MAGKIRIKEIHFYNLILHTISLYFEMFQVHKWVLVRNCNDHFVIYIFFVIKLPNESIKLYLYINVYTILQITSLIVI